MKKQGASVVINHQILEGKQEDYEAWLNEIGPICRNYKGQIDWQIIRPIANLTFTYTVILRFDTIENLKNWMDSEDRKKLIAKVRPMLVKGDDFEINSGLDFLFAPKDETSNAPVKWKQFLVTWSAIYPLVLFMPFLVLPLLKIFKIVGNTYIDSLFITGIIVFLMVYLIMPHYTKLIKNWLYN
ncbi:antibiotic biosynthesis monooxygenase [Allomuricauda sp. F6463D]|uniref:antibiotic biosynthesis monooxygenase n=1 Tax=Allomuricauda sp. F6463D TaxID=2926409 RepID=UPI001FF34D17|nr:antibiotic biosynthesis monooxygenase [Muricauda sp. F6463D]MCK0161664.1 antibiotic biosynthesis monooxygenase [Muricauda sp. F6463D]